MNTAHFNRITSRESKMSVIGLGYVGMPIAVAFAKVAEVIGFDVNPGKITQYLSGVDPTNEVGDEVIRNSTVQFTSDPARLKEASFHIVAVPTPIKRDHTPDLSPLISASEILGAHLQRGSIVVYESTVYPGVTEDICIPILETTSGLSYPADFQVGYSPERINPGDKEHRLETIVKVVSASDELTLDTVASLYELVVLAGVHRASSIKVAEAAKVIENSQRDINIAFMNELSMIFNRLKIPTNDVLDAARTKWNFLPFSPGLVGGHCIGVDPYYLTYKANQVGYRSQIITAGRRINDDMGIYVATSLVKEMNKAGHSLAKSRIGILGFTFKENCPDTRNTRVIDIIRELEEYGAGILISDPYAEPGQVMAEYGLHLSPFEDWEELDAIVIAVKHDAYKNLTLDQLSALYRNNALNDKHILFDLKSIMGKQAASDKRFTYWSF